MLDENEISIIKRKICIQFMYGMVITLSLFDFYYYYADVKPINYIVSVVLWTHIIFIIFLYKLSYKEIKFLIPAYLVYLAFFLYLNNLFFWYFEKISAFLWFCIFPMGLTIFFNKKAVIFGSIFLFLFIGSIFIVTPFIPEKLFSKPPDNQVFIDILTIIVILCFMLFFIYNQFKINQIKELQLYTDEGKEEEIKDLSNAKLDKLYTDILTYFSKRKPYRNPDFTIVQLAEDLDSNVKYISRAIKLKENVSFKVFINKYRINQAKEKIAKDYPINVKYLYIISGFRHQSTFNRVFKEIEGITPSEYIQSKQIT